MSTHEEFEYQVVLVFPGFGSERENAQEIVEEALAYLNTHRHKPGFRFAPVVRARLAIVTDAEDAQAKLDTEDDVAAMILHDLPEEEKAALTEACAGKDVSVCHTVATDDEPPWEPPSSRTRPREWKVVFRKAEPNEPRAHTIAETTLTAPLEGDEEELGDRVSQLIAVLALGVMEHHWRQHPPKYLLPE